MVKGTSRAPALEGYMYSNYMKGPLRVCGLRRDPNFCNARRLCSLFIVCAKNWLGYRLVCGVCALSYIAKPPEWTYAVYHIGRYCIYVHKYLGTSVGVVCV